MSYRKVIVASFLVLVMLFGSVIQGQAASPAADVGGTALRAHVPGEVIVRYVSSSTETDRRSLRAQYALQRKRPVPLPDCELVAFGNGRSTASVLAALKADRRVLYAEPNYIYQATTTDPDFGLLWGLENNGQTVNGVTGTADIDIDAPEAWATTTGSSSVIVGVIDTGIQISHPDIAANIWTNPGEIEGNGIDDDANGYVDDVHGWNFLNDNNQVFVSATEDYHGTHVAGTIAGRKDNGIGVVGVAPDVRIMPLKFLGSKGGSTTDAVDALKYAKSMGADLTSNSWGGGAYSQTLYDAIKAFDGPFIAAAGNDGWNNDIFRSYPGSYDLPNITSVAAISATGALASWSNFGATTVDVGAPGVYIWSSYPTGTYAFLSGTSMATPHVSGIAALILTLDPTLTGSQVRERLIASARANPLSSLAGKTVSGGLVNAAEAVRLTVPPPPDTTAPTLVSTDPASGAVGVDVAKTLRITFSESVLAGGTFAGVVLTGPAGEVACTKTLAGTVLSLDPVSSLGYLTDYTVAIPAGAVVDAAGNPLAAEASFSFRTSGDLTGPVLTSVWPANKATNVSKTVEVAFTFDEAIALRDLAKISFKQSRTVVPFTWRIDGRTLYLKASAPLLSRKTYTVTVGVAAVQDALGNANAASYTTSFTTVK
jgi:subtilisin family serine protease